MREGGGFLDPLPARESTKCPCGPKINLVSALVGPSRAPIQPWPLGGPLSSSPIDNHSRPSWDFTSSSSICELWPRRASWRNLCRWCFAIRGDSVLASNSSRRLGTVWGAHARTRSSGATRGSKRSVRLTCRCGVCGLPQQMGASETFWDDRMEITLAFLHNFSMRQSLDPLRCLSSVLLA